MKIFRIACISVFLSLLSITPLNFAGETAARAADSPAANTERILDVADFKQTNPKAGFENGGSMYCAPTSASDWLMYFANHGYPNLIRKGSDDSATQMDLVKTLASKDYLNTDPKAGSSPNQIARGLEKYISEHGYKIKRLEYQGWRPCGDKYDSGVKIPKLEWIKSGCKEKSFTLINYGWYQWDKNTDIYTRTGGHWVALVGFGKDGTGAKSADTIIVHDPIPRFSEDSTVPVYVELGKIDSGKLTGDYKGLPQDARGYYWFEGYSDGKKNIEMKSGYGVIDDAIVVELE